MLFCPLIERMQVRQFEKQNKSYLGSSHRFGSLILSEAGCMF